MLLMFVFKILCRANVGFKLNLDYGLMIGHAMDLWFSFAVEFGLACSLEVDDFSYL